MGYGGTMFRRGAKGQKVRYQSFQLLGDHGHHKEGVLMFHSGDGSNGKYGHGPVFCFVSATCLMKDTLIQPRLLQYLTSILNTCKCASCILLCRSAKVQ